MFGASLVAMPAPYESHLQSLPDEGDKVLLPTPARTPINPITPVPHARLHGKRTDRSGRLVRHAALRKIGVGV